MKSLFKGKILNFSVNDIDIKCKKDLQILIKHNKMKIAKWIWKYWAYLLPIIDVVNEDNSIDIILFQERNNINNGQINRLIKAFKDNNVLRKKRHIFYLNPLIAFNGKDIRLDIWVIFEDELNKVWIKVK